MGRRAAAVVVGGALALVACGGPDEMRTISPGGDRSAHGLQVGAGTLRAPVSLEASEAAAVVRATWGAGFAALAANDEPAGAVVSPAGLVVALAMLAEGARGESAAAFDEALGAAGDARTDAVSALLASLARLDGDPAVVKADDLPATPMVHVANQVVVDDDQRLAEPYLGRLMSGYGAGVLVTDLGSDAGKKDLDAWVKRHTGGLVDESAMQPDPALVVVLQNAITLAAAWEQPFDSAATSDQEFTLPSGDEVFVPRMHATGRWAYAERDGWRAVRLTYGADLHADVLLPPPGSPGAGDPALADPGAVAALVAELDAAPPAEVLVGLPKLDLTSTTDLLDALGRMGLGHLTSPATAGLHGLLVNPPGPPYVGQAVQQAVLKVDEEGTRAAAVTEIGVAAGSAPVTPPAELLVDRPYLFVVGDSGSGLPLFLAAVRDPRG